MPHFIVECSANVLTLKPPADIMEAVGQVAESTGLFEENDVKVRIHPYVHVKLGAGKDSFIHVFGHIMEGRTVAQRADLCRKITGRLMELLPEVSVISMNISEFEKATYCNKAILHPLNSTGNRHFQPVDNNQKNL